MAHYLCIHGHFYQPPREDPWLGTILPEDSAAPAQHWNERICRESYAPLAWARRLDSEGRIAEIMNCYEWISFNVGPTLMCWLEKSDPATYERILEADRVSLARWGHGNAIAQVYHHTILPLATERDKKVEIAWALADFEARFGRKSEGMWLAESAADIPTLEALAAQGVSFTILSPRQAKAIAPVGSDDWQQVGEGDFDLRRPYRVDLPSGKVITVFFYDGPLSRAVAFEKLLQDGENFWQRMSGAATGGAEGGLLSVCTDGETYGHHFTFGEMALAHALGQGIAGRDNIRLSNYGAYLEENSPQYQAQIHEPSSWSCVHGVERWRSNCGCTDGGHPLWNQEWRGPLRDALDTIKIAIDEHFMMAGKTIFSNSSLALLAYGGILSGSTTREAFAKAYYAPGVDDKGQETGWLLLAMQEQALAAYASCAWFFDELTRIEPVNAMTYALRALDLMQQTGGPDCLDMFMDKLALARSNIQEEGTGKEVFLTHIMPRREYEASLVLQALSMLWAEKRLPCPTLAADVSWRNVSIQIMAQDVTSGVLHGEARICWYPDQGGHTVLWSWAPPEVGNVPDNEVVVTLPSGEKQRCCFSLLPRNKQQAITSRFVEVATTQRLDEMAADAVQLLSMFAPWQEAQHEQTNGWYWRTLTPALCIAFLRHKGLDDEQEEELARYLCDGLHTSGLSEMVRLWAEAHLLDDLAKGDLEKATRILLHLRKLLPHADVWAVQNRLWQMGVFSPENRELALALGFKV